jgi:YebC/PmpR family DNA-binding regulatory protein
MSGHSKWNNIKNKKAKTDAAKGKIFTRIGKEIAICVRDGGGDPSTNGKLRDLIQKAKANNVPNDNIERAIKKALGADSVQYEEIRYEGYGPAGVAVIVETATDSKNRTASNVRHYFDKYGGNLGATGCVSYMFEDKGVIILLREDNENADEDELMEAALEAGAEDFSSEDEDFYEITTEPADLITVQEAITAKGVKLASADVSKIPQNYVDLTSEDDVKYMTLLLDKLEEDDDVQQVYHNWNGSDEE